MQNLLHKIRQCNICTKHLRLELQPIATTHPDSKIIRVFVAENQKP